MIQNEEQYELTKSLLARFRTSLTAMKAQHPDPDDVNQVLLHQAQVAGIESQIEDFEQEMRQYEQKRSATAGPAQDVPSHLPPEPSGTKSQRR